MLPGSRRAARLQQDCSHFPFAHVVTTRSPITVSVAALIGTTSSIYIVILCLGGKTVLAANPLRYTLAYNSMSGTSAITMRYNVLLLTPQVDRTSLFIGNHHVIM